MIDLQTIFYSLGIVFMLMMIFNMIVILAMAITVANKVKNFRENFAKNIIAKIGSNRREVMSVIGLGLSSLIASRLRNFFIKK